MTKQFTDEEEQYIDRLLAWKKQERKRRLIFYNSCLIAGMLILLFAFLYILQNPDHRAIYQVGIPGILIAVPLLIVYTLGLKSTDEKHLISSIFRKWKHKKDDEH
jgi:hypothetical protein